MYNVYPCTSWFWGNCSLYFACIYSKANECQKQGISWLREEDACTSILYRGGYRINCTRFQFWMKTSLILQNLYFWRSTSSDVFLSFNTLLHFENLTHDVCFQVADFSVNQSNSNMICSINKSEVKRREYGERNSHLPTTIWKYYQLIGNSFIFRSNLSLIGKRRRSNRDNIPRFNVSV